MAESNQNIDTVVSGIMEIALSGTSPNPVTGDQEVSDALRLKALQLMAEMIGLHKGKQGNALLSLTQILYAKK